MYLRSTTVIVSSVVLFLDSLMIGGGYVPGTRYLK